MTSVPVGFKSVESYSFLCEYCAYVSRARQSNCIHSPVHNAGVSFLRVVRKFEAGTIDLSNMA